MNSRGKRPWSLLWIVVLGPPVVLVSIVLLYVVLLLGSRFVWDRATPEEFTLPEGFIGHAYVIYDSLTGRAPVTRGRTQIYHIPASGVLVTRSDHEDGGWLDEHFYYRRHDGSLAPIREVNAGDAEESRADTTIGIYDQTWGRRSGDPRGDQCRVRYAEFFVGRNADVLANRGVDGLQAYFDSCDARAGRKHEAPGTAR